MGNDFINLFSLFDGLAVAALLVLWFTLGWRIETPHRQPASVSVLMSGYRREWMRQFVTRQPRIFDATVIANLRLSTHFLASASMIALGALLALIGNIEPLLGVAQDLSISPNHTLTVEIKLMLVAVFLGHAFLKFLWSNRLFGYAMVLMSAVPNDPADPMAYPRAAQAAEVNVRAAFNFNRGLRAIYFALAALVWVLGAWGLMAATLAVAWLIWSREFASHSRQILLETLPR